MDMIPKIIELVFIIGFYIMAIRGIITGQNVLPYGTSTGRDARIIGFVILLVAVYFTHLFLVYPDLIYKFLLRK